MSVVNILSHAGRRVCMSANMLPETGPDFDSCNNKGTNQPVHQRCLIRAFIFSVPGKHILLTRNIQNSVAFVSKQVF